MLHNAPSLDLSSIILYWKKSWKIDHVSWIDTELIWNLIFPNLCLFCFFVQIFHFDWSGVDRFVQKCERKVDKSNQNILAFWSNSKTRAISTSSSEETSSNASSDTSSSDTSIKNASSNESLENQTEAFGEISLNPYSGSTLTTKYCTGYKIIEIQNLYMEFYKI